MKERGMTKKELISKSGISSKDYELMENNMDVSLATLCKICRLLDSNYENLISLKAAE